MGQRIAAARAAKGWTQSDLASALGRTYQQVSAWERDAVAMRETSLYALAKALEVRPDWLRTGQGAQSSIVSMPTGGGKTRAILPSLLGDSLAAAIKPGLGNRVRKAREEMGLDLEALASQAQLSRKRIAEIEKGGEGPSGVELLKLGEALGVSVRWIATGRSLPQMDGAHEAVVPYRNEPIFDRDLLARALRAALKAHPSLAIDRLVDAALDAYEMATKPGRTDKVEHLVLTLLE